MIIDDIFTTPPTDRELEVLDLLSKGFTNNQIAKRLYISYATVKSHIGILYTKFNDDLSTSESSTKRTRMALKYLELKGYLKWNSEENNVENN